MKRRIRGAISTCAVTIKDTHWKLPYVVVGFDYTKRPLWQSVSLMVLAFYNASAVVIELLPIILLGSIRKACHTLTHFALDSRASRSASLSRLMAESWENLPSL